MHPAAGSWSSAGLARARAACRSGSRTPHTTVVLPSYSMGASLVAHYGERIPALEHRQLLTLGMLARMPEAEVVFVTSKRPAESVLDYHLSFVPADLRDTTRARIRLVEVPDPTTRSISAKLLDRPDLLAGIRAMTRGRLAHIEPWNVTELEVEVARRLGLPLNGTPPHLWPLGFKSNGRRLMRMAGVPLPLGHEDVRSVADVVRAAEDVRRRRPGAAGVVVKLDNSGTGDGNRVIRFVGAPTAALLEAAVESLEPWYLAELAAGGVVEELVTGQRFSSPSVQIDIAPGRVDVISTHEQIVGGPNGQVYLGCRFPADGDYARQLATYGRAVGTLLAERGAMGRLCVDFAAAWTISAGWQIHGLEINLRRSGTSHPLALLEGLVPGQYDLRTGGWAADDGTVRCYRSTDNLVDPAWRGRPADDVIHAVRAAGLDLDPGSGTGAVLHMLIGLDIDGRVGLTAIGTSPGHAEQIYQGAVAAIGAPVALRRA